MVKVDILKALQPSKKQNTGINVQQRHVQENNEEKKVEWKKYQCGLITAMSLNLRFLMLLPGLI